MLSRHAQFLMPGPAYGPIDYSEFPSSLARWTFDIIELLEASIALPRY